MHQIAPNCTILKFFSGGMPPNTPNNAHGFAMRGMSLCDMQISKSQKKIIGPPTKSWLRPYIPSIFNSLSAEHCI